MEPYASQDVTTLAKALIEVQRAIQPAFKDAENTYTHSNYATLNSVMDSCREALLANGIWLIQFPIPAEPGFLGLVTKLTHAESGQWQSSHAVVPLPKNDPQGLGIAMTYTRRYALSAMLGIVCEEDTDGAIPKARKAARAKEAGTQPPPQRQPAEISTSQARAPDPHLAGMPKLDGITYQSFTTQDNRICITASGQTRAKKQLLLQAGFKWNEERRIWWRYAESA